MILFCIFGLTFAASAHAQSATCLAAADKINALFASSDPHSRGGTLRPDEFVRWNESTKQYDVSPAVISPRSGNKTLLLESLLSSGEKNCINRYGDIIDRAHIISAASAARPQAAASPTARTSSLSQSNSSKKQTAPEAY